jgi:hypothetical protein
MTCCGETTHVAADGLESRERGIARQIPERDAARCRTHTNGLDSVFVTNCLGCRAFIEPAKTAIN